MATKKTSTKTKSVAAAKPAPKKVVKTEKVVKTVAVKPAPKKASVKTKASPTKATAKTSSKVVTTTKTQPVATEVKVTENKKQFKIKRSYIILVVVVLALAALIYFGRSLFVAAVVNGQPISRLSVLTESEKQSGKQVLTTLVRNTLIEQEARKKGITVSDKEIDDEISKLQDNLKKQGQTLDDVLAVQGMSRNDLRQLIRLDKLVGKLVGQNITITDKQVDDYIAQNKDSLPQGEDENTLKSSVRDQLKQQALNDKVQSWLDNLEKNSNIIRFVDY